MAARAGRIRAMIVAADAKLAAALQSALQQHGMEADMAASAQEAVALFAAFRPVIVVIDCALAAGAGLVRQFAAEPGCGVLAITSDGALADGAQDQVSRPLMLGEVVARVRALHRRIAWPGTPSAGSIVVDHVRPSIAREDGAAILLDEAEYRVLITLLDARGTAVSRDWLGRVALPGIPVGDGQRIGAVVEALRRQLVAVGAGAGAIRSVRGQGYVIADPAMFRRIGER